MPKLLMIINEDRFFLSHRREIALAAKNNGFDVTIVSKDTGHFKEIESLGLCTLNLPITPTGMNLLEEFKTFLFLRKLYKTERPDIVHHVGLKNILWGGVAAKITKVKGVVNAVSGLGGLFNGNRISTVAKAILKVMSFANRRDGVKVIFQNNDDKQIFIDNKVINLSQIEFTKGSGINLSDYQYVPEHDEGKVKIMFTARMVKEKGICDLIEAAEILRTKYSDKVIFQLCGRLTANQSGVTKEYMDSHCDGSYICWLGERDDIHSLLEKSHIMAFPSYYREGVPKSLIEASAIGRPIVTCDSVGCRDVVDDGVDGCLVEPKNPAMLADRLERLIADKDLRIRMGQVARAKAERDFNVKSIVDTHMKIYNELLK